MYCTCKVKTHEIITKRGKWSLKNKRKSSMIVIVKSFYGLKCFLEYRDWLNLIEPPESKMLSEIRDWMNFKFQSQKIFSYRLSIRSPIIHFVISSEFKLKLTSTFLSKCIRLFTFYTWHHDTYICFPIYPSNCILILFFFSWHWQLTHRNHHLDLSDNTHIINIDNVMSDERIYATSVIRYINERRIR